MKDNNKNVKGLGGFYYRKQVKVFKIFTRFKKKIDVSEKLKKYFGDFHFDKA